MPAGFGAGVQYIPQQPAAAAGGVGTGGGALPIANAPQVMPTGVPATGLLNFLPHALGAALGGGQTTGGQIDPTTGRMISPVAVKNPIIDRLLYGGAGAARAAALNDRQAQVETAAAIAAKQAQQQAGIQETMSQHDAVRQLLLAKGINPDSKEGIDAYNQLVSLELGGAKGAETRGQQIAASPEVVAAQKQGAIAEAGEPVSRIQAQNAIAAGPNEIVRGATLPGIGTGPTVAGPIPQATTHEKSINPLTGQSQETISATGAQAGQITEPIDQATAAGAVGAGAPASTVNPTPNSFGGASMDQINQWYQGQKDLQDAMNFAKTYGR
jgi:hypothetical protein